MDSLVANYASSDDDEAEQIKPPAKSLFRSLPQTKSSPFASSLFSSLPPPQTTAPSSQPPEDPKPTNVKKVVKFTPPINLALLRSIKDEDDDDDDLKKKRKSFEDFSSKKSLFELMPAPKSSRCLGIGAASVSSGRKSAVEADNVPNLQNAKVAEVDAEEQMLASGDQSSNFVNSGGYFAGVGGSENDESYYNNGRENWDYSNCAAEVESETVAALPLDMSRVRGKRGRNIIPLDIVEVKQDELVKNRPRPDQVKATGIAFGPAYQVSLLHTTIHYLS